MPAPLLVLSLVPVIALSTLRLCADLGVLDGRFLPAAILSGEALAAAAILATAGCGGAIALALRSIARDTREILMRTRARDQAAAGEGADVVDFAIHLDRRRSLDLRRAPGVAADLSPSAATSQTASASRTLSELKSRLAHIPSVRAGGRDEP